MALEVDKVYDFIYRHPGSNKQEKIRVESRAPTTGAQFRSWTTDATRCLSPSDIAKITESLRERSTGRCHRAHPTSRSANARVRKRNLKRMLGKPKH